MFRSRFAKLGAAGFAAVTGVILVVSTVGAHQSHSSTRVGISPFTGIATNTTQAGADVDNDAAADAAAMAAELQKEAAEKAAALAAAQQEAAQETAEDASETDDTETGDINSGDETEGDNEPAGTKGAPKTESD